MRDDFFYLLSGQHIKKLCEFQYEDLMKEYSLRVIELEILFYIGNSSALRLAREIVDNWNMSKAHVSKSLEHLRLGGFIEITEDILDHRCAHFTITQKGYELIVKIGKKKQIISDILYQGVTKEEKEVLAQVALKIRSNICLGLGKKV